MRRRPISASRSTWYRIRKHVAKRRGVLAAALLGAAAVAVTAALLVPRWQRERARAEQESGAKVRAERLQRAMQDLNRIWSQIVATREWTRQAFRRPAEILAALEASAAELTAFVHARPDLPQGWYVRARVLRHLGDFDGAEADLRRAIEVDAAFVPARPLLALVLHEKAHALLYSDRPDDTRRAEPLLHHAADMLRRSPPGDTAQWGLSRTREDEVAETCAEALRRSVLGGDTAGARVVLEKAHAASPSEEYCRMLYVIGGTWQERVAWLKRAIDIAPHFGRAWVDQGAVHQRAGDFRAAVAAYDRALAINPRDAVAHYNRGTAHASLGDRAAALADYTRAVEANPRFAPAWNNRASSRHAAGDLEGALADIDKALAADPGYANAWANRGSILGALGRREEGAAAIDQALKIDDRNAVARVVRGNLRRDAGDIDGALLDYAAAINANPLLAAAWYGRAVLRVRQRDFAAARDDYYRAIEAEPGAGDF